MGDNSPDMTYVEPKAGMEFNSPDEVLLYYKEYARKQGFAVAKRSSRKGDDGKLTDVNYECNKRGNARTRGNNPLLSRPQTKVGCPAHLTARVCPNGKWRIGVVNNEHNHDLGTPGKTKFLNPYRVIDENAKRRLELNDVAGIRLNKSIDSLQLEAGGFDNLTFTSKDCRNYLAKIRRLNLVEGDADAMHQYFLKMKSDNSEFFYAVDLDEEGRLKNVFWADARSRAACKEFGDVVTFDTTYSVNKYDMPFAPFVGVNHHGQSILLGCGLISHEDTESFVWLFETWKKCMWDCAPKAIITDQCMAMKNAIKVVFTGTQHRLCIWHIMKKVPEKLSGYKEYERISCCMRKVVYDTFTIEEFEAEWFAFIAKYHLEDNVWLKALYVERQYWVPAYVKGSFWAGMSSTQRSESMHSYFDGYINSKTTLKQFVEQYEIALKKKVETEKAADASSWNSYIPCISKDELEKQFHDAYTHDKVREFREQFSAKLQCQLGDVSGNEFVVKEWVFLGEKGEEYKKRVYFKVVFNSETNETHCNCRLFEFSGMVCKHQLMVWNDMGVTKVPDKYILRRWCKNIKRAHTKIRIGYDTPTKGSEANRHDSICRLFKEVAYLAEDSEEKYERVMKLGHELKKEFEEDLGVCDGDVAVHQNDLDVCHGSMVEHGNGLDVCDGRVVDHRNDFDVSDGNMVDHRNDLDGCDGHMVNHRNGLDGCDGNMVDDSNALDVFDDSAVDRPNALDVCDGNTIDHQNSLVACDVNMLDRQNALVVYDGNMIDHCDDEMDYNNVSCAIGESDELFKETHIRDPKVVKRKGRPRVRRFESHVDKVVKAKKRKCIKQKAKESKKKQFVDTTKDGDEPQHDLFNVIPNTIEMAQVGSWYNNLQNNMQNPQSHMPVNPNSLGWRGSLPVVLSAHQRQDLASQIYLPGSQALCEGYIRRGHLTHLSVLSNFIGCIDGNDGQRYAVV